MEIRAILGNRLKLNFMKRKRPRGTAALSGAGRGGGRSAARKPRLGIPRLKGKKNFSAVQRKVRVLSGLVPGCRKEALPEILEEASKALEMRRCRFALCRKEALRRSQWGQQRSNNADDS